ncbi:MAG: NAD(P)/FAD-dependent oxidoreductase [Spirochaetes bacterium]|nr:NAD(P)/FAD-dependent oxidoreductase [Spirochaetota bacterium]
MSEYDLIIIGAGSGGYRAAVTAGSMGKKVLVIERHKAGGVCLHNGCVPSKTFYQTAKIIKNLHGQKKNSLLEAELNWNMEKLIRYRDGVISKLEKGIEFLFKKNNIEMIKGQAHLIKEKNKPLVMVNDKKFQAPFIIVATGSRNAAPSTWQDRVLSPDEFIRLGGYPGSVAIIGGGVIGCEFAGIFSQFNVDITVIEKENRLLPFLDKDLGEVVEKSLKEIGVKVYTGQTVSKISDGLILSDKTKIKAEKIIACMGRRPNTEWTEDLIQTDEKGFIKVDNNFKTSCDGVYAVGDVINKDSMYAHLASFQGEALVLHLFQSKKIHPAHSPYGIFTFPQIAGIGMSEDQAVKAGLDHEVIRSPLFATSIGKIQDDRTGFMKVIKQKSRDKLFGIHVASPSACEMIHTASVLFNNDLAQAASLKNTVFIHPTESEIFHDIQVF